MKSLLNDQFQRLSGLCQSGNIAVSRWQGDIGTDERTAFLRDPRGILQITPESLETLFVHHSLKLAKLFHDLAYVVIDEMHLFLESLRGAQLICQLERLTAYTAVNPRKIGISATLGDFQIAQRWLAPHAPGQVQVISAPTSVNQAEFHHLHELADEPSFLPAIHKHLFQSTWKKKSLIFCNSRKDTEILSKFLNAECGVRNLADRYSVHHGSIAKESRESLEEFFRETKQPHSVVCTNSLEVGVDIGGLDLIAQVDSPQTVAGFAQRVGRTGRRAGTRRVAHMYTQSISCLEDTPSDYLPFDFLQSMVVAELYQKGWIEPNEPPKLNYTVLLQQLLSALAERGSLTLGEANHLCTLGPFQDIPTSEVEAILCHLIKRDILNFLPDHRFVLTDHGTAMVKGRTFGSIFQSPVQYQVMHGHTLVGTVGHSNRIARRSRILLSGRMWEIDDFDQQTRIVQVVPAETADQTSFQGCARADVHPFVAESVRQFLLYRTDEPLNLNVSGQLALREARLKAGTLGLHHTRILNYESCWKIYPWAGSRVIRRLVLLLQSRRYDCKVIELPWRLTVRRKKR
ncbi:MAG: DEAD/DEAH box helicase [Blastocatellia bacterium]|nr:DEAD/DEAH box helicase [Blastocatellia bacterium]